MHPFVSCFKIVRSRVSNDKISFLIILGSVPRFLVLGLFKELFSFLLLCDLYWILLSTVSIAPAANSTSSNYSSSTLQRVLGESISSLSMIHVPWSTIHDHGWIERRLLVRLFSNGIFSVCLTSCVLIVYKYLISNTLFRSLLTLYSGKTITTTKKQKYNICYRNSSVIEWKLVHLFDFWKNILIYWWKSLDFLCKDFLFVLVEMEVWVFWRW